MGHLAARGFLSGILFNYHEYLHLPPPILHSTIKLKEHSGSSALLIQGERLIGYNLSESACGSGFFLQYATPCNAGA